MKTVSIKKVLAGAGGVTAVALVSGVMFGIPQANAGIANTKHNLTGTAGTSIGFGQTITNSFAPTNTNAGEICVFCHTPHGSDTSASVPLWNRKLGGATYTTYNSLGTSSLDGAVAQVGSVSLACLSCHDGTQAMNAMVNLPGSGGYNAASSILPGTWTGANVDTGTGEMKDGVITNLGVDLRNDHPIGIQYAGGPKGTGTVSTSADFVAANFKDADFNTAKLITLNSKPVWYVETSKGDATSRDKKDMQLYTRTSALANVGGAVIGGGTDQPYVECASCHDPHTDENPTFLRISNTGSAVCLACHIK